MTTQFTNSHHHGLSLTGDKSRYKCDGCFMDGHGERHRCNFCDYDLHKECLNPNRTRTLEMFPGYIFKFQDRPPRSEGCSQTTYCGSSRACDICGLTVKGFVYHCEGLNADVHPLCANLEKDICLDGVKFELQEGLSDSKCNLCNRMKLDGSAKKVPGFRYVSRGYEDCSFHVACLMEMGIKYLTSSVGNYGSQSCNNVDDDEIDKLGQELVIPRELKLKKKKKPNDKIMKFGRVVGLFLKIVLSVIFGDPTMILASMVVHLLKD